MHPRNRYLSKDGQAYQFDLLIEVNPSLSPLVKDNGYGKQSIDFADHIAVKELNRSLLLKDYQLLFWDIPPQYLCPPVPGRLDYVHYLADLLSEDFDGQIPTGKNVKGLDIGTGANLIYPIVGSGEYNWSFVGSDIEQTSISCASQLIKANKRLQKNVKVKLQPDSQKTFTNIIANNDRFAFTMCNPPFHSSAIQAAAGSARKSKNLGHDPKAQLNFGGQSNELWCEGGEAEFVCKMVSESSLFSSQVIWFTSLVSSKKNLLQIEQALKKEAISEYKIIEMGQGNKQSRFIAWTFLNKEQRQEWFS